jgi:hypothetical protein
MATAKKKPKIQASDVEIGNRTLEGVLIDLAEQAKVNAERSARAEERSVRAEERAEIALRTIAAVSQDFRAITQELRDANRRTDGRLDALEKAAGA